MSEKGRGRGRRGEGRLKTPPADSLRDRNRATVSTADAVVLHSKTNVHEQYPLIL